MMDQQAPDREVPRQPTYLSVPPEELLIRIERLATVLDNNTQVFQNVLAELDMQSWISARKIEDLTEVIAAMKNSTEPVIPPHVVYVERYLATIQTTEESSKPDTIPAVADLYPEAAQIFGGDNGQISTNETGTSS